MNANVAVRKQISFKGVVQGVVDKHRLSFRAGNRHTAGLAAGNTRHLVTPERGIGDEIHQNAVVLVIL